jgi:hypothetical protein
VVRRRKSLTLAAVIAAVAMMFIDQTIIALAVPGLEQDLSLSATGSQWIINGYLLALSALFALGGKVADVAGHRRMVVVGRRRLRRRLRPVRRDAGRVDRRGVDHHVPGRAGSLRGVPVPGRAGHRGGRLPDARPRREAGDLLRDHGRAARSPRSASRSGPRS